MPVVVQVGALAALAVVMSQAVAFALVVLAPEPRPAGISIADAARALKGEAAETVDGRPLRRRISSRPVARSETDGQNPLALAIRAGLANSLGTPMDRVAVSIEAPVRRFPGPGQGRRDERSVESLVFVRRGEDVIVPGAPGGQYPAAQAPAAAVRLHAQVHGRGTAAAPVVVGQQTRHFTVMTDRLTFAPFSASLQLEDGRWATVEPPRDLLSPWQMRLLLALGISLLLLAPLVWWMARRLTRPIRVFAEAAERLGADPEAPALRPSGPTEVRTAIHAFNEMQASLRDHIRQRTHTVAAIAHDLRTPLTRLRFRAEQAPGEVRDRMASDIEEMDALIGQAMAFVRGEARPEAREAMDLAALAHDCARGFAETGAAVAFAGGAALPVTGDPAALRRALGNLIGNAVKYGGDAQVRALVEGGSAVIEIEDRGPGLPEGELEAVFEPFKRGERSRSRETGGAGLGLTVARQAARAAGGEVTLRNRAGGGLVARLALPLAV